MKTTVKTSEAIDKYLTPKKDPVMKKNLNTVHIGKFKETSRRPSGMLLVMVGQAGAIAQTIYEISGVRRLGDVLECQTLYEKGYPLRTHELPQEINNVIHATAHLHHLLLVRCEENDAALRKKYKLEPAAARRRGRR